MQKRIFKVLAVLLVLVMAIGSIPVSAAKNVEAGSKKEVNDAIGAKKAATVTLATDAEGKIVIHSQDGAENNKKLVIDAPNADIINYGSFKAVNIVACKSYREKGNLNTIYVKDNKAKIKVCKDTLVSNLVVQTKKATIEINEGAGANITAKKANAKINIEAEDDTLVGVTIVKKATVNVKGSDESLIGIQNLAEGSKIIADSTVYVETEQDLDVVLNAGAEASVIDKASDAVDVDLDNNTENVIIVTIGGEIPTQNPDNASTAAITVEGIN